MIDIRPNEKKLDTRRILFQFSCLVVEGPLE